MCLARSDDQITITTANIRAAASKAGLVHIIHFHESPNDRLKEP
jgi:hypothetical protein